MDSIFHLIGFCPDHYSHINILDIFVVMGQIKNITFNYIKTWLLFFF
jgi:hypothetical protein